MTQVNNKNIDNASGQVVRLDIQNTLKAVTTNNFGSRNDAGTILPCEFLADSTTNKLLIRKSSGGDQANPNPTSGTAATFFSVGDLDQDNLGLLPKAGGTMTGQLLGDDGSFSGSPAFSFNNDTDTGMYRSGANTIGFSTGGTARVSISNAGLDMSNGLPIRFQDSSGAPFVALKSPSSVSSNVTFTLPGSIVDGGFLKTDASGNLSFSTISTAASDLTGSTLASGVTASSLTSVGTLTALTVSGNSTLSALTVNGDSKLTTIKDTSGGNPSTPQELEKGRAKAWVYFNFNANPGVDQAISNSDLISSYNISSVVDNGARDFTINFSFSFDTAAYIATTMTVGNRTTSGYFISGSGTTSQQEHVTKDSYRIFGPNNDPRLGVVFHGDV